MKRRKNIILTLIFIVVVMMFLGCNKNEKKEEAYNSIKDLQGKNIGVVTATAIEFIRNVEKNIPECQIKYFDSMADLPLALSNKKISGFLVDQPIARKMISKNPSMKILSTIAKDKYGYIFTKDEKGKKLNKQMDEFLTKCKKNGILEEIDNIWFGNDLSKQVIDTSNLSNENGIIDFSIDTTAGEPFIYMKDGTPVGYEVDIAVRFAKEYGYGIEMHDSRFAGVLSSVTSGKTNMGAGSISITEERKQAINFSDSHYEGGMVIITNDDKNDNKNDNIDTDEGIKGSFEKTFIKEQRWKLFVNGIGITILITLLSTIFGSIIGFLIYMLYRKNFKPFVIIVNIFIDILQKTPVVVILMILFYVFFGRSNLNGVWVAVVGFSIMFAFSCVGIIRVGVGAIDKGQTEAALALGFTDTNCFLKIVFPQAAKHFLPVYKGQIVSLLKDTAIVGYIAVQDLTKVGDIVRSRTYEAFFPLISIAIIYFILAWILTLLVRKIEFNIDPKHRKFEKIMKGVEKND